MKRVMGFWLGSLLALIPLGVSAQVPGSVYVPASSIEWPGDAGRRAHTNHLVLVRPDRSGGGVAGLTPVMVRGAYNIPATGGSKAIAIVDAFDDPSAQNDFKTFSAQFGIVGGGLSVVYASGAKPSYNSGWAQEASLDIEWAHAMAPSAQIILVEAASNGLTDLLNAVSVAASQPNVQQVSMSWGGGEFSGEISLDKTFTEPGVVYFAASGDTGGKTIWPSTSPNVVACGGTTLNLKSDGSFISETAWSGSGGGQSPYESLPGYQGGAAGVGTMRSVPDVAMDANPNTGVLVYWSGNWYIFGGTSCATPTWAGIVNQADSQAANTADELTTIYNGYKAGSAYAVPDYRDIVSGRAGHFRCKAGWDFVTGVGSPLGLLGK